MQPRHDRTIVFDISSHGFGHLGQVAPIIRELDRRHPKLRVVLRSLHPATRVRDFLGIAVAVETPPPEAIFAMLGSAIVDVAASAAAFQALHADWDGHVEREAARLAELDPDLLVADVPYLSLAAAKRIGVPAIAICSLNWLDIYRAYCGAEENAPAILDTIGTCYRSAAMFLQSQPHMAMTDLPNRRSIGPLGRIGRKRKAEILAALGLPPETRIVLVTFGGFQSDEPFRLPEIDNVHWLVPAAHVSAAKNASDLGRLAMNFTEILISCDAVLTKVGYCTIVDAACNGVGIVTFPRADWPEAGATISWAKRHARFALADRGLKDEEGLRIAVLEVLKAPPKPLPQPSGVKEAADLIASAAGLI
jgi:hypothetical protein